MTDLFQTTCPCCGQTMPDEQESPFNDFWQKVPHKIGRKSAVEAWGKLKPQEKVEAKEKVHAFYVWFKKTYPTASPLHPSTYLNKKRGEDEGLTALPTADRRDILSTWAKRFKAIDRMPSYLLPRPDLVRELLEAGRANLGSVTRGSSPVPI